MPALKKYPPKLKERAVRRVLESRDADVAAVARAHGSGSSSGSLRTRCAGTYRGR